MFAPILSILFILSKLLLLVLALGRNGALKRTRAKSFPYLAVLVRLVV